MKNLPTLHGFCLCLTLLAAAGAARAQEWKLVWSDEFDKPGRPDPAKWAYEEGFVRNQEAQYYTADRPENARVENGVLIIEARKEPYRNPHYKAGSKDERSSREAAAYSSASLRTKGLGEWRYGRFEIRAKIPRGLGIWPALWMMGNTDAANPKWPDCGELDIMEFVGFMPSSIHGNVHNAARYLKKVGGVSTPEASKLMGNKVEVPEPWADFHLYAMEWDAEHIEISVDGRLILNYKNPHAGRESWPYDHPFYLIMNIAVGGAWGGEHGIDDSIFPQRMEVDYVRVYQRK